MAEEPGAAAPATTDAPAGASPTEGTTAPAAAAETPPAAGLGSDAPPLDWRTSLPEDVRGNPTIAKYKSQTEAAKALIEANRLIGDSIRLPKEDNPDAWGAVWNKLGRPETHDGYTEPEGLELPEGVTLDPAMIRMARENAHAKGYTQAQYEAALQMHAQWLTGVTNQMQAAQAEAGIQWNETLAKKFGASAPRVKDAANAVWETLGNGMWGEEGIVAQQEIVKAGLHTSPALTIALANIFERMREGQYEHADSYLDIAGSPVDVEKQIATLMEKQTKSGLTPAENKLMDELYEAKTRFRESDQRRAANAR